MKEQLSGAVERAITEKLPTGSARLSWKETYVDNKIVDHVELKTEFNNRELQQEEDCNILIDHLVYLQGCLEEADTKIENEEIVTQVLQGLPLHILKWLQY